MKQEREEELVFLPEQSSGKNWATKNISSSPKFCIFLSSIPSTALSCSWLAGLSSAIFRNVRSLKSLIES